MAGTRMLEWVVPFWAHMFLRMLIRRRKQLSAMRRPIVSLLIVTEGPAVAISYMHASSTSDVIFYGVKKIWYTLYSVKKVVSSDSYALYMASKSVLRGLYMISVENYRTAATHRVAAQSQGRSRSARQEAVLRWGSVQPAPAGALWVPNALDALNIMKHHPKCPSHNTGFTQYQNARNTFKRRIIVIDSYDVKKHPKISASAFCSLRPQVSARECRLSRRCYWTVDDAVSLLAHSKAQRL